MPPGYRVLFVSPFSVSHSHSVIWSSPLVATIASTALGILEIAGKEASFVYQRIVSTAPKEEHASRIERPSS